MGHGIGRTGVERRLQLKMEPTALNELRTLGRVRPRRSTVFSSVF